MTYAIYFGWNGPAIYRQVRRGRVTRLTFIAEFGLTIADRRTAEAVCAELNRGAA